MKARRKGGKGVREGGREKPGLRGQRRRSSGKKEAQRQRQGRKGERKKGKKLPTPDASGSTGWAEGPCYRNNPAGSAFPEACVSSEDGSPGPGWGWDWRVEVGGGKKKRVEEEQKRKKNMEEEN